LRFLATAGGTAPSASSRLRSLQPQTSQAGPLAASGGGVQDGSPTMHHGDMSASVSSLLLTQQGGVRDVAEDDLPGLNVLAVTVQIVNYDGTPRNLYANGRALEALGVSIKDFLAQVHAPSATLPCILSQDGHILRSSADVFMSTLGSAGVWACCLPEVCARTQPLAGVRPRRPSGRNATRPCNGTRRRCGQPPLPRPIPAQNIHALESIRGLRCGQDGAGRSHRRDS
jgi:hypothetical protein